MALQTVFEYTSMGVSLMDKHPSVTRRIADEIVKVVCKRYQVDTKTAEQFQPSFDTFMDVKSYDAV